MDEIPPFVSGLEFRLVSTRDEVLDGIKARGSASKDKLEQIESNIKKFKDNHKGPTDDEWNQYIEEYRKVMGTLFPYQRNDVYVQYRSGSSTRSI